MLSPLTSRRCSSPDNFNFNFAVTSCAIACLTATKSRSCDRILPPKLRASHGVHQIYLNVQSVLHLPHLSCQHRRHPQLAPHLARVDIFAFVTKSRRACDDSQSLQLAQAIDQRLRNSSDKYSAFGSLLAFRTAARDDVFAASAAVGVAKPCG